MGNLFNKIFNGGERALVAGWWARDARRAKEKHQAEVVELIRRKVEALEKLVRLKEHDLTKVDNNKGTTDNERPSQKS